MELNEVIAVLEHYKLQSGHSGNIEALQTAISYLETLQKVKEMGGVKKRNYVLDGVEPQDDREYEPAWVEGWNDCLDAIHAELAGKLKGLGNVIENWFIALEKKQGLDQAKEIDEKGLWGADCKSVTFKEIKTGLTTAIQELLLGKKGEGMKRYPIVCRNQQGYNFRKTCQECEKKTDYAAVVEWTYMRGDDDVLKLCKDCQARLTDEEIIEMLRIE